MQNEQVEIALLTGGASRRMGQDKASLIVNGEPIAQRLVRIATEAGYGVTVLGKTSVADAEFLKDSEDYAGPLSAIRGFEARLPFVFLLSCDVVLFDPRTVASFSNEIGEDDAVIPVIEGYPQPLCALYRSSTLSLLRGNPGWVRIRDWTSTLQVRELNESELARIKVAPRTLSGANTPEEFARLCGELRHAD